MNWYKSLTKGNYTSDVCVSFIPTSAGSSGEEELRTLIPTWSKLNCLVSETSKADEMLDETVLKTRIINGDSVVEELLVKLVHDEEILWLLPGVRPTYKEIVLIMVTIAKFKEEKLSELRLLWDQGTVLKQIGLILTDHEFALSKHVNSNVHAQLIPVLGRHEVESRFFDEKTSGTANVLTRMINDSSASLNKSTNLLKKDSIGEMLSGKAYVEAIRPSTRLSSDKLGAKSHIFDDASIQPPSVVVDPRRFETHFSLGNELDEKSFASKTTVLTESSDMHLGRNKARSANNQSHFTLDNSNQSPFQETHFGKKHFFTASQFSSSIEMNKNENSEMSKAKRDPNTSTFDLNEKKQSFRTGQSNKESISMWAASSNGLGGIQDKPSSRVLNVPGGKTSIMLG